MNKKKIFRIAIFGSQGSGKGTQAELMARELGVVPISVGEILRREIKKKTALGKKIRKTVLRGKLAPTKLINALVIKRISGKDCRNGFVLDGYPRNIQQLKFVERMFNFDYIFELFITGKEITRRLSSRLICADCGKTYNTLVKRPKNKNICDICGGELISREDESSHIIKNRLAIYRHDTLPVIRHYARLGKRIKINGQQPIKKVFSDIIKHIAV